MRTALTRSLFLLLAFACTPLALHAQEASKGRQDTPKTAGETSLPGEDGELQVLERQQVFTEGGQVLPLGLQRAIDLALENNENVTLSRIAFQRAIAGVTDAEAIFDPIAEVSVGWRDAETPQPNLFNAANPVIEETRFFADVGLTGLFATGTQYSLLIQNERTTTTNGFATLSPQYTTTATVGLTQPLLRGFGLGVNLADISIARTQKRVSGEEFSTDLSNLVLEVVRAYWNLYFAIRNLENQLESLEVAKDLIRIARNRVRVELDPPIALTQARAGAAAREEAVLQARNQLGLAEDQLKALLGLTRNNAQLNAHLKLIEAPATQERIPDPDEAIRTARRRRPEYEIARLIYEGADTQSRAAENEVLPELNLSVEAGLIGVAGDVGPVSDSPSAIPLAQQFGGDFSESWSRIFSGDTPFWQVSGTLRFPIGNNRAQAQLARARADEQEAITQFQLTDKNIVVEVRGAIRNVITNLQRMRTAEVNVDLAVENLEAERRRYENGLATSFNVLEQEEQLNEARSRYQRALADYNISLAEYRRATGQLLDQYGIISAEEPAPPEPLPWERYRQGRD